jgi:DNA-binding LacI/PurR family transcriptional regulator
MLSSEIVRKDLSNRPKDTLPDIIVCENDALAIGAIDTIRHTLKLRVPEDIAIIGFDDVPLAETLNYRLTTYRQPITEMAEYLVDVLESDQDSDLDRTFLGQLVVRDTA